MAAQIDIALVFRPGQFSPGDYQAIAHEIRKQSADFDIYIIPDAPLVKTAPTLGQRPLLTFCPTLLRHFRPPRGKVFSGQKMAKDEQLRRLAKGGVRVPKWIYMKPNVRLSEAEWGPYVIVKPVTFGMASGGRGVELARTSKLTYVPPNFLAEVHPGAYGETIIQRFIDTGEYSEDYRVVTMFGRPLYALRRRSLVKLLRLEEDGPARTTEGVVSNATSGPRESHFCYEEDVLSFAVSCYRAIPEVPFQAIDVRRDYRDGKLYCLEINPGGNTWNFSSARASLVPTIDGLRREEQFGAWKIAAEALIENARLFAA